MQRHKDEDSNYFQDEDKKVVRAPMRFEDETPKTNEALHSHTNSLYTDNIGLT